MARQGESSDGFSSRRPIQVPLGSLVDSIDRKQDKIHRIIQADIGDRMGSAALAQHAVAIKEAIKEHSSTCDELYNRYIKIGSVAQAQEALNQKLENSRAGKQFLQLINAKLREIGEQSFSNIDVQSEAAREDFLNLTSSGQVLEAQDLFATAQFDMAAVGEARAASASTAAIPAVCCEAVTSTQTRNFQSHALGTDEKFDMPFLSSVSTAVGSFIPVTVTSSMPVAGAPFMQIPGTSSVSFSVASSVPVHGTQKFSSGAQHVSAVSAPLPTASSELRRGRQFVPGGDAVYSSSHLRPVSSFFAPPHVSHAPSAFARQSAVAPDPATMYLLRQELFKTSGQPFNGDPTKFNVWWSLLQSRMKDIPLDPLDKLSVLAANTTGEPRKLVESYMAAGIDNPDQTFMRVWEVLANRHGSPIQICASLRRRIDEFPPVTPPAVREKLQELMLLCQSIEANMSGNSELTIFNLASGQQSIWMKFPESLQQSWRTYGHNYINSNRGQHPPLFTLVGFLSHKVDELCNPNFEKPLSYDANRRGRGEAGSGFRPRELRSMKTEERPEKEVCPFHNAVGHSLGECKSFSKLPFVDRRKFARESQLCFKCLGKHFANECASSVTCAKCKRGHSTLMHNDGYDGNRSSTGRGGNRRREESDRSRGEVDDSQSRGMLEPLSLCTAACEESAFNRNCSKTVLTEIFHPSSPKKVLCYTIIDEQSNSSFVDTSVMNILGLSGPSTNYSLTTMSGMKCETSGYIVEGLRIRGVNDSEIFELPSLLTSESIPDCRHEVASPRTVGMHPHVAHLSKHFPEIDTVAEVLLLLGRDCGNLMKTECHGHHSPFAHRTPLGWALVGGVCTLSSYDVSVLKTSHDHLGSSPSFPAPPRLIDSRGLMRESGDDDLPGISRNDLRFLDIMDRHVKIGDRGRITMPLPFKREDIILPMNKHAVFHRTRGTLDRLKRDQCKLDQCIAKMSENLKEGHVERLSAQETDSGEAGKTWWLPVFPVTHPKKNKTRLVFDSSARFKNVSLNDSLLTGPDDLNRLRGVLMRFRRKQIGFTADIESMFYNFGLVPEHRNYTRFFWFSDNDPQKDLVQYRGCVHLFGNRPSPAIAHYGLKHAASQISVDPSSPVCDFVLNNFYVDDGLGCADTVEEAFNILGGTVEALKVFKIRLHKIASNSNELLRQFPTSELSYDPATEGESSNPVESTLGISWDLREDKLFVSSQPLNKPFTRRGLLSSINSLYDPLGLVSPVILGGKLIQRRAMVDDSTGLNCDWDSNLPEEYLERWNDWKKSVETLDKLSVPRSYVPDDFGNTSSAELHVFADASDAAIGAVAYLRLVSEASKVHVSFVISTSRLVPRAAATTPRAELCAALEACYLCCEAKRELAMPFHQVTLHSDSKVVLGYLRNEEKRFSNYVTNRVHSILKLSDVEQWTYVPSGCNPADISTRPHDVEALTRSFWLKGPEFLWMPRSIIDTADDEVDPGELPEVLREVSSFASSVQLDSVTAKTFSSTKSWSKATRIVQIVLTFARRLDFAKQRLGIAMAPRNLFVSSEESMRLLVTEAQAEHFGVTLVGLLNSRRGDPPVSDPLSSLDPFLDCEGVIRVGGRLENSLLLFHQKHPILLPHRHPISASVVAHYHERVLHQGRHLTHGAIRDAGYHIHKGTKLIKGIIFNCVKCRRIRASPMQQKMSDLPAARLQECPPFSHSGMDVFGPFTMSAGRTTRRSTGSRKIWVLLFTCMASRAVHVEPLHGMDISSFRNAHRRFTSVRGHCTHLYCDRGTNFVGAHNQDDHIASIDELREETEGEGVQWHFNSPYASHHGGVWERKIGSIRRAMDISLSNLKGRLPSFDEFTTFICEASGVVNNTPLWEVSSDPKDPLPLSPAMLLTLRGSADSTSLSSNSKDVAAYGRNRWRRVQFLADCFWQEWRKYYLHTLQERRKWMRPRCNLKSGDVVLLRCKSLKRNQWPMAIVQSVKLGSDNLVRSASIRTANGKEYLRPVSELILLVS